MNTTTTTVPPIETTTRATAIERRARVTRASVAALLAGGLTLSAGCAGDTADPGAGGGASGEAVGQAEEHWDTESPSDENQSTHLFIVNRALDILGKHTDQLQEPNAAVTAKFLRYFRDSPACKVAWQQGLYDADFVNEYNSNGLYVSHFYDPSTISNGDPFTGHNYLGTAAPTALTEADKHFNTAVTAAQAGWWGFAPLLPSACYEMGLALHYLTDVTQPMHAANFTAASSPAGFHTDFETYAVQLQHNYVCSDWTSACDGKVTDNEGYPSGDHVAILVAAAKYSRQFNDSIVKKASTVCWPARGCCDNASSEHLMGNGCWNVTNDELWVGPEMGLALKNAQRATAQFIWRWFARLDAAGAHAPAPFATEYKIVAKHSGLSLDTYGSLGSGASIFQETPRGTEGQRFVLNHDSGGYYSIMTSAGMCLDVSGASTADGASVIQWPCSGADNQRFQLVDVGNGYSRILAKHSNKCLDIYGAYTQPGVPVIQWPCSGADNQSFAITAAP